MRRLCKLLCRRSCQGRQLHAVRQRCCVNLQKDAAARARRRLRAVRGDAPGRRRHGRSFLCRPGCYRHGWHLLDCWCGWLLTTAGCAISLVVAVAAATARYCCCCAPRYIQQQRLDLQQCSVLTKVEVKGVK